MPTMPSAEQIAALVPRVIVDKNWCGPENFIKASDVLPIVVPEDGPAEFNFREMVYRVLDEKRYDMIKT